MTTVTYLRNTEIRVTPTVILTGHIAFTKYPIYTDPKLKIVSVLIDDLFTILHRACSEPIVDGNVIIEDFALTYIVIGTTGIDPITCSYLKKNMARLHTLRNELLILSPILRVYNSALNWLDEDTVFFITYLADVCVLLHTNPYTIR